jgi:hypothetical protein
MGIFYGHILVTVHRYSYGAGDTYENYYVVSPPVIPQE